MNGSIEAFEQRWDHVHAMTLAFVQAVPDRGWDSSPHPGFAPVCKQVRHVVCVRGVYNDAFRSRRVDFSRKHEHYDGDLSRPALLAALIEKHEDLKGILSRLPGDTIDGDIDFFGSRISFGDHFFTYVQHEAIHHGQWSIYAALAGFEVPELWRVQWGLEAGAV